MDVIRDIYENEEIREQMKRTGYTHLTLDDCEDEPEDIGVTISNVPISWIPLEGELASFQAETVKDLIEDILFYLKGK